MSFELAHGTVTFCGVSEQLAPVYPTKHTHVPSCTHLPWPEHVLNILHDTDMFPKPNVPLGLAHGTGVVVFCGESEQLNMSQDVFDTALALSLHEEPFHASKHLHTPSLVHLPCPEHVVNISHITESWPYVPLGSAHGVVVLSALSEQFAPVYWSKHRHAPSLVHLPCPEHVLNMLHGTNTPPLLYVPFGIAHGIVSSCDFTEQFAPAYPSKHLHVPSCTHLPWPEHVLNMLHTTDAPA